MLKIVECLWGSRLGRAPFVKSWWPYFDMHKPKGYSGKMLWQFALREWGIAWPVLGDRKCGGHQSADLELDVVEKQIGGL